MGKPVRMADIAEKLGISVVSVSKALAGKPGVSEEMRGKVVALARQLGYEGARFHSGLGETSNIGVLVSDRFFDENTFYTLLYRSLVLSSSSEGLTCMLEIVSREAEDAARLPALVTGHKVDGLIFMGNLDHGYLQAVAEAGLPCVLLDFHMHGLDLELDCIVGDNAEGGCALTEHLLAQGYREIGFAGSILATSSIMDRYLGYQKALRMAGIVPREEWRLEDRDGDGRLTALRLPQQLPRAFVCSCDEVAYNLVAMLQKQGLRVPEDVAVCGYDDYRFATLCQPQLTTYRVSVDVMARTAVNRLMAQIRQEGGGAMRYTVPGRIVVRESSGAAAARG